ncbi:MAG TPA: undecaprenyl-diphosphate phosphatase [Lachnospiraceae bacterium]|nr:undecaprenyl-diphosphate phosphatase [Lachnospiraceae bacterium]
MNIIEILKVIVLGIVEGITEWLPISSTGHLIIVNEFLKLKASDAFVEMFNVVIQLGAILAVIVLYFKRLWPIDKKKDSKGLEWNKDKLILWAKILVACVPAGIIGILFDDKIDEIFYNPYVVSVTLIIYGVAFILIEIRNRNKEFKITDVKAMTFKTALIIGLFQVLALIPGTSRSGATIVGAMLIGTSRTAAAEFTFFLAIPVMAGASIVKILKFVSDGTGFTQNELYMLIIGMLVAYLVSMLVIKFLMSYIRKHDFKPFGVYRIILGIAVLLYFTLS